MSYPQNPPYARTGAPDQTIRVETNRPLAQRQAAQALIRIEVVMWILLGLALPTLGILVYWSYKLMQLITAIHDTLAGFSNLGGS